jgi:hypothetical protein
MCATLPAHLIICDLVTVIFYEEIKLWSSSVCNFLQPSVSLSLLDPNNLLNTLFLNTCICLFQDQASDPFETTCKVTVWRFSVAGEQETLNSNVRSTKWHLPAVIIMIMENVTIYYQKQNQHLTAGKPDTTSGRSRQIWVQKSPRANIFSICKEVRRYLTGWYRTKRPIHFDHYPIYCVSSSELKSFLIHPPEISGKYQQTPSRKAGETRQEMPANFATKYLFSHSAGFF